VITRLCVLALGGFLVWANLLRLAPIPRALVGAGWVLPVAAALAALVVARGGRMVKPRITFATLAVWFPALLLVVSVLRSPALGDLAERLPVAALWFGTALLLYTLVAAAAARSGSSWSQVARWTLLAPAVFVMCNLLLWVFGVEPPEQLYVQLPEGRLTGLLGLQVTRVLFPLGRGVNNFGVVAGLGLAVSGVDFLQSVRSGKGRFLSSGVLAVGCLVAVVLCDSRGPLLFGLVSICVVSALASVGRVGMLKWFFAFAPILPILLWRVLPLLADSPLIALLSRRPGDIATATGRVIFWSAGVEELRHPSAGVAVGWGQYGHVTAGVSQAWADQFTSYVGEGELMSIHNGMLQLIFDVGVVGVLAWGWLVLTAVSQTDRPEVDPGVARIVAGVMLYVVLAASTESVLSLYFPDILLAMFLTAFVAQASGSRTPPQIGAVG